MFDRDLAMHAPWWRATFGRRAALPDTIVAEAGELEAMLALVEAGVGLAVLPDYVVAGRAKVVDVTPAGSKPATGTLFLATRSAPPPARVAAVLAALS